MLPRTRAYCEIWLDEERVAGSGEEEETIYGSAYLPRKFKIGFAIPPSKDIDVFARSEEHTSELQSLMRISYAVFCLQKKNKKLNDTSQPTKIQRTTHRSTNTI